MVFGRSQHLVGVLSTPTVVSAAAPPGIVLVNSGIIHRIGANRVYVRLARALAVCGSASLRFDLSGIGDSTSRPTSSRFRAPSSSSVTSTTRCRCCSAKVRAV